MQLNFVTTVPTTVLHYTILQYLSVKKAKERKYTMGGVAIIPVVNSIRKDKWVYHCHLLWA